MKKSLCMKNASHISCVNGDLNECAFDVGKKIVFKILIFARCIL